MKDEAALDFSDMFVYGCIDVNNTAVLMTAKLVEVLNFHTPWVIFQQHKDFVP